MIIGLGNKRRVGKDTVADILVRNYGFKKMSFTHDGGLQDACMALNPIVTVEVEWNDTLFPNTPFWEKKIIRYADATNELGYEGAKDKYPEVVRTLQRMGTEVGRDIIDPDVWVNIAIAKCDPEEDYVFTNCRFANESAAIHKRGGVVVLIERPGLELNDSKEIATHSSELADGIQWDWMLCNDGTVQDLELKVGYFMMGIE